MSTRIDRSMHEELVMGSLDGTVRMLRPNSAAAEEDSVTARAGALHSLHYGFQGLAGGSSQARLAEMFYGAGISGYGPERYRGSR